jgi:hypothetical protein
LPEVKNCFAMETSGRSNFEAAYIMKVKGGGDFQEGLDDLFGRKNAIAGHDPRGGRSSFNDSGSTN